MPPKIRVVIAEDEENYRRALRRTIEMASDIDLIAVCKDGKDAFDCCSEHRPDVLLTDINMPHVNGLELIHRVFSDDPSCRIVVLTVRDDDETIFDAFRWGACSYLLKTSMPNEVLEAIRLAYRGEAKITPRVAARLIEDFRRTAQEQERSTERIVLSIREREILELLSKGMRNAEIAAELEIAEKTVKNHVSAILKALQVGTRTEAALKAVRTRLVSPG